MSFEQVRDLVAEANRVLAAYGLSSGAVAGHGHASMRIPEAPDRFVVKGRGAAVDVLARSRPEEMIVCDLEGYTLEAPPGFTPALEVKMHSCIYRARPDVQAIVHTHARFVAVLTVIGATIRPMCQEGIQLVRRPLPVYPHVAPVLSDEEGTEVARLLGEGSAILLEGHGATTTAGNLEAAVMNMINLEEQAKMNWYAYCAAGPGYRFIPDANVLEVGNVARAGQLPHLKEVMSQRSGERRSGGVYAYYANHTALRRAQDEL
jgi:ribulose-5-phosphate 4-epimerase/fuculose-1-phosphate aldolase